MTQVVMPFSAVSLPTIFLFIDKPESVKMIGTNSTATIELNTEIDSILQNIQRYYTPILVILGLLGNCLSMWVFFGTKLRYSSSSIYLGVLAISDSGFLIVVFVNWLKMVHMDLLNRQGFCQLLTYLIYFFSFLSVWLVVAFTVERYVAVRWPLRRQFLCTVARAKMTVIGLSVLAILLSSPVVLFRKINKDLICYLNEDWNSWANAYNYFDTVMTFAIPLTMIVIFNILIARNIYKLEHVRRTLTIESDPSNERTHTLRDRMPQTKVTKMLLLVSTAFFFLNMPAFVLRVIAFNSDDNELFSSWFVSAQQMCQLLFQTSFGINFILYCTSGQNFRREIFRMCTKHSSARTGTLMQMASHVTQFTRKYSSTKRSHFIDDTQQNNPQETQKLPVNQKL